MRRPKTIPAEITITYRGEKVKVDILDQGNQLRFEVFLPGTGPVFLHVETDGLGNETWYDGAEPTKRATELGELIEIADW
jgi:hypothetical protein